MTLFFKGSSNSEILMCFGIHWIFLRYPRTYQEFFLLILLILAKYHSPSGFWLILRGVTKKILEEDLRFKGYQQVCFLIDQGK